MRRIFTSRMLVATTLVFLAASAQAVVPWTLLVNTNNVIIATNAAYGAVGDGVFTNTIAIQNAIKQAAKGGVTNGLSGGTVRIPGPGIYLSGPLYLTNNVNLQIDAGAILRMLPFGQYPMTWYTNNATNVYFVVADDFINGNNLTNIAISGFGAIDGQGSPWWPWAYTNNAARPVMISLAGCNRELIQNITLSNSPCVHISVGAGSGNTVVQYITERAPSSYDANNPGHNTDACDVRGTNILVQFNNVSVGDDDFSCLGNTSDVVISNNIYGDGHGTSMGSQLAGGCSNFLFINCSYTNTDACAHIKSDRDRGSFIHNISYYNLTLTNVMHPIQIFCEYTNKTIPAIDSITPAAAAALAPAPVTATTPMYRDITISNLTGNATNTSNPGLRAAGLIWGLPECSISNVTLIKVNLTGSKTFGIYDAKNVQIIDSTHNVPAGVSQYSFFDADVTFSNSTPSASVVTLDGATTDGFANKFTFYNCAPTISNTNALALNSAVTLGASTFTISNNFAMTASNTFNFILGTNTATVVVKGNLTLGGTNNIFAGNGFTNGTYTLMTYTGVLGGNLPALGAVPGGYNYQLDTNTAGVVKLLAGSTTTAPAAPTGLTATASNASVVLNWSASATATNYNVKRSTTSGSGYVTISSLTGTNYSDLQVTNGRTYFYVVSATNAGGESVNSTEASATPKTLVFSDTFSGSSLNSAAPSAPTAAGTSYELTSSKAWNPTPTIAAGHLKFGIASTGSGVIEAQALFANAPIALTTVGDMLSLAISFTNTVGLFAQTNYLGIGLYNSGQNYPVPGGLNGTATSAFTTNTNGNAQPWVGYVGQIAFTNTGSQILTRPMQTASTLSNNCQDVVTSGSGSSSYNYPAGVTVGAASSAASVVLATNSLYTEVFTITLTAANTLAITNALYSGADSSGTLLSQFGVVASGATYLTNSFDALAIGWRAAIATAPTLIDITKISVSAGVTISPATPPSAPANLQAIPTNLLIKLNWNAVSGATNYNLKRGTTNGGPYPTVFSGLTATNYSDANVTNTVNYYYVVTAVAAAGESTNSVQASAAPLPSGQPTNLTAHFSGSQLQLSWPQDHLGWRLQIQTNNLATGLNTNWATVPNSTNVMATNITIVPANGSVFLRLVYP